LLYTITKKQRREVASLVKIDPTVVGGLNRPSEVSVQRQPRLVVVAAEINCFNFFL